MPFLTSEVRPRIIEHIKENARLKQIYIDTINGHNDHIHCLIGLNADMTIAKTLQLLKGESAYWINKNGLIKEKFEWADEYFAVCVCDSILQKVRQYINNQEIHHRRVSYSQEYEEFMIRNKFQSGLKPGMGVGSSSAINSGVNKRYDV